MVAWWRQTLALFHKIVGYYHVCGAHMPWHTRSSDLAASLYLLSPLPGLGSLGLKRDWVTLVVHRQLCKIQEWSALGDI